MATTVLTNVGIWIDGRDYAGVRNQVGLELTADAPEATVFKDSWRSRAAGGLKMSAFSLEGFFDQSLLDQADFDRLASAGSAMIAPAGQTVGDVAFVVPLVQSAYTTGASIGEILPVTMAAEGDGEAHRGDVFEVRDGLINTISGGYVTLDPIGAGDELVLWAHVQVNGDGHMNLELRSRPTQTTGTQTQRAIRLGITQTGVYELRVHGPVSDRAWHLLYALAGGSNRNFEVAAASNVAPIVVIPAPPIIPPTPMTHALLGGLSADATPISSEISIQPVPGQAGRINYGTFVSRHVLIARDASQPDITSVTVHADPTHANQLPAFTKYATAVNVSGTNYNVWVSNQTLAAATDFVLDVA